MSGKIMITAITLWLLFSTPVSAGDGWQIDIQVSLNDAQTRLSIGQKPEALDGRDGRYDVPALLFGDILAYIEEPEGEKYWRKFRESCAERSCAKKWDVLIESELEGGFIRLKWSGANIAPGLKIVLLDLDTGAEIDMRGQSEYQYKSSGRRKFQIEVQH